MDNQDTKPKTITSIDLNIQWPTQKAWLEELVEDHLNCILCGEALVFNHKTDFIANTVVENAHCPGCRVKNRQSKHVLQ